MNLFFISKKEDSVLKKSFVDSFVSESGAFLTLGKSPRFNQLVLILISEQDSGFINLYEIEKTATLLELFEKKWNDPGCTPALATQHTFNLLYLLSNSPQLQKTITDKCLTDFFSGVVNLDRRLDFEKTNKEQHNLMIMSSRLSYVQLGLCFFEAQIQPYWSMPADAFFHNIYYIPPECNPLSHVNKLRCLLLQSELVFNIVESNKASSEPSQDVFSTMQEHLKRIRMIFLRIIMREMSPKNEFEYLKQEYEFFLENDSRPACVAYILFSTTRISLIKKLMYAHFAPIYDTFNLLKQTFDDLSDSDESFDKSSGSSDLDAFAVPELDLDVFAVPEPDSDVIYLDAIYFSIRSLINKEDFKSIYQLQMEFQHLSSVVKEVFLREDPFIGPSLIVDMLSIFDKKKTVKGQSLLSVDKINNAGYVDRILSLLFPEIKDLVQFFVKGPVAANLKHSLLGNLINCYLILLSVFNETHYFNDRPTSPQIFKKKIEQNLIFVLEHPLIFANSFHVLYFLAHTHAKPQSELQQLLDDLGVILDVLREGGEKYKIICQMLLNDKEENFPLESVESIKRVIDKDLRALDQQAEQERLKQLEESLFAESEKPVPAIGAKKKKKKKGPKTAGMGEVVDSFSSHLTLKETNNKGSSCEVLVGQTELSTPVPSVLLSEASESVSTLSPVISDVSDAATSLMPLSKKTMEHIERLSELNQLLSREQDSFRAEIQLHQSQMSERSLMEQNALRGLDKCLDERQKIMPMLRGYLKKARKQAVISFAMERFSTELFLLPDWLDPNIRRQHDLLHSCIELLRLIEEDKSCTLSLHVPALIEVLGSASITMCSLRELRSYHYLSHFRAFLSAFMQEFRPILVRLISNEHRHFLEDVAVDVKNFGQLMLQVQHWTYSIAMAPFDVFTWDTPRFQYPCERSPLEAVNPAIDLRNHLVYMVKKWNFEVNSFAMALSKVIALEPESTFISSMKELLDRLSSCYFKNTYYPCEGLVNRLFHSLAEVELYGTQLFMRDSQCDVDARLKWHNPHDSYEHVVAKIKEALIKQGATKAAAELTERKHKLFNPDRSFVTVLKIKVPMDGIFPVPLDLSIFVGTYFPLVSYVSHAAGILDIRTGRISCPHDFFESILKNQLLIKEPSFPDFSDKTKCSRLAHVLKLIVRVAYPEFPGERIILSESAEKILGVLKATNISELKKVQPHWVEALGFLLKQHFEHYEFTVAFFKRTAVLLSFYKDIGCTLVADTGVKKIKLIGVNKEVPQLVCAEVSDREQVPLVKDFSAHSFFVSLPKALLSYVSLKEQVPHASLRFFGYPVARPDSYASLKNTGMF